MCPSACGIQEGIVPPHFHWLLHLWKTLQRNGALLNCFCLERKHRMPKRYATDITNAQKLNSASLLMEVTCHHLSQLQQPDAFQFSVGLVGSCPASRKVKKILSSEFGFEQDGDTAGSIKVSTTCRFSLVALYAIKQIWCCLKMGVVLASKLARSSCILKCMAWHFL